MILKLLMGESLHCALLLDYVPPEEPLGTPLETPLELCDPNWTGGDLEGNLPGSCGSGEGPGAFGGEFDCVLGGGDGGQSGGKSELGMAKYGFLLRLDAQIVALHAHCTRTVLKAPPMQNILSINMWVTDTRTHYIS